MCLSSVKKKKEQMDFGDLDDIRKAYVIGFTGKYIMSL